MSDQTKRTPQGKPGFGALGRALAFGLGLAVVGGAAGPWAPAAQAAGVLRIGNDGEPQSMDPHFVSTVQTSRLLDDMYLALVTFGAKGEAIPGAAERWTISPDGLTYTFTLRDHTWSDGTPVTAEDFVYSWRRVLDPAMGAEYASLAYIIKGAEAYNSGQGKVEDVAAKALDAKTLEVTLTSPAPYFLAQLTHQVFMPVPKHVVEKYGRDWTKPETFVVNGAYKLASWLPNVEAKLVKNENFYDAKDVFFDEVIYYTYEDRTAMQKRYRAGELDICREIASEQITWLRDNLADSLRIAPYAGIYDYAFNTTQKPFDDLRVRQALTMAVDVEAISEKVLRTGELPAWSFVPPGVENYTTPATVAWKDVPFKERQEKARALLAEAGFSKDKPLTFTLRYNTSENHKRVAVAIASMWKQIGVSVELFNTDGKIHYADLKQKAFQVAREGWIADYNDPQSFLFKMEGKTGPLNYSGYDNPEYNALMDEGALTIDLAKRAEILKKAEALAMRDVPVMPIYYYVSKQLVSPKLVGWHDNALDKHVTRFLSLK
ncbi:peptide ABC transporter substrate-binding protein [Rhodospirillum rubrum]|uniref:Extracellular solute-binding protein, family 5 n=1 Tax=Rhodospirillum rubrum (strain ATCC 11170 / ATH 1.1.1 / DSM 467 / LMG 4362 / NCIMB 8255 / S1) TaxID=269796 RepID=Q2RWU9_RHORT|nr:peptide ABC transporter substrate-binding protein [Rhodospirillum rubrum]ABC21396.1 extracellular solute-binding protein, family 5 [Rhodospirillum rubrum ATCC 11170]AEO47076.1 extracellular solute-binding protein [Rhodospirillum rubrum F11]MBK5952989.1 peptide ABC transporter substrate-binding protein [Rhodospirillum rubrum]QXG81074.1 peptide ABC transporter substrate-binding protein [Rhodospirillum rubrum]HCF18826.1 peptide ABC transporter substrate-binding protein [Rhodospirillum rubrum]